MKDKPMPEGWTWQFVDKTHHDMMQLKYEDRKALSDEAVAKRKAVDDIDPKNPFYHRACVSAEMAQMRCDMSYLVLENKLMREQVEHMGWLMERVNILEGAYSHIKMVADSARIDYGHIAKGLSDIIKLKGELTNETTKPSNQPDGAKVTYCRAKADETGSTSLFKGTGVIVGVIVGASRRIQIMVKDDSESKNQAFTLDPVCIDYHEHDAQEYWEHHLKIKGIVDEHNKAQKAREQEKISEVDKINAEMFGAELDI